MRVYYSLYGRLLNKQTLQTAFTKVKRANGAAGIDGQSISDFENTLDSHLDLLLHELKCRSYTPLAVKRVEIPKDDGGVRLLGIPCVRDRVVQQALTSILSPIFDAQFHPSSYGYRPQRSAHDAINKATLFIRRYGLQHVVDMDLSKCFDCLDHKIIINSVKRRVTDSSVLRLIKQFLCSGVMIEGEVKATTVGSPQGGVISPLLANIYLDSFDQEMRQRGHRIVRYADDILIFCRSRAGAENARKQATSYLEKTLKLQVNQDKSHIAHSDDGVKFLSVEIGTLRTDIQAKKLKNLKGKLKQLTRRKGGKPLSEVIAAINPLLRGFSQYFKIANAHSAFKRVASWLRRRLRSIQLRLWKTPMRLKRRLAQCGYRQPFKGLRMTSWRSAYSPYAHMAMPNDWFTNLGLVNLDDVETGYVFSGFTET
jgi:group II intron reverse transcriptase/maturase